MNAVWALLGLSLLAQESPAPSPHERMRALAERYAAGDVPLALSLVESLLGEADALALAERTRAELLYARGLFLAQSAAGPERLAAVDAFQSARALAGPGALRLDATYDAGVVQLLEAERLRATIPEVAARSAGAAPAGPAGALPGVPAVPPVPPGVQGLPGGPGAAPAEDPLPAARAAYLAARGGLVERLRAGWQDEDTRANLELIQRRLRELEELERQREEQEQEQQQDEQGQGGEENEEGQEGGDGKQEPQDQDGEKQEGEQQEGESEDPLQDPSAQPEESETETEPTEAPAEPEAPEQGGETAERHLTREEVLRLLDRLAELDQEAQALRAALGEARRQAVERDW